MSGSSFLCCNCCCLKVTTRTPVKTLCHMTRTIHALDPAEAQLSPAEEHGEEVLADNNMELVPEEPEFIRIPLSPDPKVTHCPEVLDLFLNFTKI